MVIHSLTEQLEKIIKADSVLLFDMDGTLINTDLANYMSYKQAIQHVIAQDIDITYNPDERFNRKSLKKILPNLSDSEYARIIELKNEIYIEHLSKTKLNESLLPVLKEYYKSNQIILVTTCRESRAYRTLEYHKIDGYFSHKFYGCKLDGKSNKYLNALSTLAIPPNNAVVFENEKTEIDAAKSAGIPSENIIYIHYNHSI